MTIRIPLPRWMHHLWAVMWGFFWLPCPVCTRPFGGHETNGWGHTLWLRDGSGKMTCPRCPIDYKPDGDGWILTSKNRIYTFDV